MASSSNRHPIVLLGAAASLITVLGFFGVRGWPGTEPPAQVAATQSIQPAQPVTAPPPTPSPTCVCPDQTADPTRTATLTPTPSPTLTAVSCVIEDRLGEGQVTETVTVRFGSKDWELTVDESDRTDRLALRFPRAGAYDYQLSTVTELADGDILHGTGRGTITCRGGQTFQLVGDYGDDGDYGGGALTVSLREA